MRNNNAAARIEVIPQKYWNPIKEGNTLKTDKAVLKKTAFKAATTAIVRSIISGSCIYSTFTRIWKESISQAFLFSNILPCRLSMGHAFKVLTLVYFEDEHANSHKNIRLAWRRFIQHVAAVWRGFSPLALSRFVRPPGSADIYNNCTMLIEGLIWRDLIVLNLLGKR